MVVQTVVSALGRWKEEKSVVQGQPPLWVQGQPVIHRTTVHNKKDKKKKKDQFQSFGFGIFPLPDLIREANPTNFGNYF